MTLRTHFRRRALGAFVAATALASTVVLGSTPAAAVGSGNEAQLKDASAFFRNQYAEVGARPNGSFGSGTDEPAGWHGNFAWYGSNEPTTDAVGVGFRVDRGKDGWGVGRDDGDFFLPGSPYEGWFLQTAGSTLRNSNSYTDIVGEFAGSDTAGDPSVTWDSPDSSSDVSVHQTYSVPADGSQQLNIDVTLTNPGGSAVDALYGRGVDPDNCVQYKYANPRVCPQYQEFQTTNTILSQRRGGDARSAVSATADDGSNLVLWTGEPASTAVSFNTKFGDGAELRDLDALPLTSSTATPSYVDVGDFRPEKVYTQVGNASTADSGMTVVVRKTVPANGSVTFRVSYSLSTDAFNQAVAAGSVDLTEGPLDTMTSGAPFTFDLAATGIAAPTFTVSAGTLPAGLTLDPTTGNISGTPTTAGPYDFSVTASGTEGSVTKQYTGTVLAAAGVAPTWTDETLGALVKGVPFNDGVAATGDGPITYLVLGVAGSLPAGLTLDPETGAITGTPTTAGPYSFTVVATNEFGFVSKAFSGVVGERPVWTDTSIGRFVAGKPFSDGVAATGTAGGTAPITYLVLGPAGLLPAGITLNPATGALTGSPTTPGPYGFTLIATNSYGSVTQRFEGTVLAPRTGVMGAVMFVGQTGKLQPEGRRALDLLAAAVPRGAQNVQVQVFGWAEAKRTTRAVLQLGATRVKVSTAELKRRGVAGIYSGKVGGRYPVPGRTGRRAEVVITWDNPVS